MDGTHVSPCLYLLTAALCLLADGHFSETYTRLTEPSVLTVSESTVHFWSPECYKPRHACLLSCACCTFHGTACSKSSCLEHIDTLTSIQQQGG